MAADVFVDDDLDFFERVGAFVLAFGEFVGHVENFRSVRVCRRRGFSWSLLWSPM